MADKILRDSMGEEIPSKQADFELANGKIATILVPKEATEQEAKKILNTMISSGEIPNVDESTVKQSYDKDTQTLRSFADPYGFGGEIESVFRAISSDKSQEGTTYPERYVQSKQELNALQNRFREDYPGTSGVAQLASMLGVSVASLSSLKKFAPDTFKKITESASKGKQFLKNVGIGAIGGVVQGAGEAENISDIPLSSLKYGVLGAGGSTIIGGAGAVLGASKKALQGLGLWAKPEVQANKIIIEYLNGDKITADQAIELLDEMRRIGLPDPVIADLSANMQTLGSKSFIMSKGKDKISTQLLERQDQLKETIFEQILSKSKIKSTELGDDYLKELVEKQRIQAKATYPEAEETLLDASKFKPFWKIPAVKDGFNQAKKIADKFNEPFPTWIELQKMDKIPTKVLSQIKSTFNDLIESDTKIGIRGDRVGSLGRKYSITQRALDKQIRDLNPSYAKANDEYADAFKIKKAYDLGQKSLTTPDRSLENSLDKMTNEELEAFRSGFVSKTEDVFDKFEGVDFGKKIFGSRKKKNIIKKAFDNEDSFNEFSTLINKQSDLITTSRKVLGGSDTAAKGLTPIEGSQGGYKEAFLESMGFSPKQLLNRATGVSPAVGQSLSKQIFEADPAEQYAILKALKEEEEAIANRGILKRSSTYGLLGGESPAVIFPTLLNM